MTDVFPSGTLWEQVVSAHRTARERGVLQPIPTRFEYLEHAGAPFVVRVVARLAEKAIAGRAGDATTRPAENPFLPPYEPELYVASVSRSHVGLLNRFPVIDHHLLVVTREFERQEAPLSLADFEALWRCLAEYESLGFYNGGATAGASQPHRHLQLVPLPLAPRGPAVPIQPLLESSSGAKGCCGTGRLPLRHVTAWFASGMWRHPREAARTTRSLYREALLIAGLDPDAPDPGAYNLLVTRRWLLLVPRSREFFDSISLNAMAFAGALFVQDEQQLAHLKATGPMAALQETSFPDRP